MKVVVAILSTSVLVAGCAGKSSPRQAAEPTDLTPAVWAPKRIYASLDAVTRVTAERLLADEARKDCGGRFESRSLVAELPALEQGRAPVAVLAIEYVCTGSAAGQSLGIEAPVQPALQ